MVDFHWTRDQLVA